MSTLKVTNIQATGETASRAVSGVAAAWVYGDASAGINDSINVSTGTDHGTGDYSYDLSSAFTSLAYAQTATQANIAADLTASRNTDRDASNIIATEIGDPHAQGRVDSSHAIVVHGDLA